MPAEQKPIPPATGAPVAVHVPVTDFSQTGEQEMILAWAERHGPGRWLDIGAADGVTASNTHALAIAGWAGVAVEPAAALFDRLTDVYRDTPHVECVQACVTHNLVTSPLVPFYYSHDLVSTTEQANVDTWSHLVQFRRCYVAAVSVIALLHTFPGPYDFASVDTEGTSVELWHELRALNAFAPGALAVIEAEDGGQRWEIQQACLAGWARVGVTENNVLLERL